MKLKRLFGKKEAPVEEPAEEHIEEPVEEPVEEAQRIPAYQSEEMPLDLADAPEESVEETPVEASEEPVEASEEPAEAPVEEPAEAPVEEPVDEAITKEPGKEKGDWDGCGSGMLANLKRWYYTRVKGYVILREFGVYWDADKKQDDSNPYDCYITHRLIKKKDLPPEAVHCTGEPYTFSIDHAKIRWNPHDNGFKATDAWLYLKYNGFDDCLTKKWTDMDHVNPTKLMLIMGAVAVGIIVMVLLMRH